MITVAMIAMIEEDAVGAVIQNTQKVVPEAEILIVDSSDDRTPEIAATPGARVIRQYPLQGYGAAMDLALRSVSGDAVVTLYCDNPYPEEVIPEIVGYILDEGYDSADCSRLERRPKAMPLSHYMANEMFARLASVLLGRHFTDLHSGMPAYRTSLIDSIEVDTAGAALPVELLLKPIKRGFKVKAIFINYRERVGISTVRGLETSWWTLKRIPRTCFGE